MSQCNALNSKNQQSSPPRKPDPALVEILILESIKILYRYGGTETNLEMSIALLERALKIVQSRPESGVKS